MNSYLQLTYTRAYIPDMNIATRLDQAMREAGFPSQSALAREAGVPQPTINRLLKGGGKQGPSTETVRKLAVACNVNFEWLNEGIGEKRRTISKAKIEFVARPEEIADSSRVFAVDDGNENSDLARIRKVKLRLSAGIVGFSIDAEEKDTNPIYFRRDWLLSRGYRAEALIAIRVKGESMEPNLYEGDTVVVNTDDRKPKDGDVFAVNYEGEAVVKRLVRDSGSWWLSSDNLDQRRFHRKHCAGDGCLVIGRIIHKQSERI